MGATRKEINAARTDAQIDALCEKYGYSSGFKDKLKQARTEKIAREKYQADEEKWKNARIGW